MNRMTNDVVLECYTRAYLDESLQWFSNAELRELTCTPVVSKEVQDRFFESIPSRDDYYIWGLSLEGRRIGACGLKHVTDKDAEYWGYIGVPELWGRGLGAAIVLSCIDKARQMKIPHIYLRVLPGNVRAYRLYLRLGFVEDGRDDDGLIKMSKVLEGGKR